MKCVNCGHTKLKNGFLTNERGLLYYKKGVPGIKNQLVGKRKKIKLMICEKCGHMAMFAEK